MSYIQPNTWPVVCDFQKPKQLRKEKNINCVQK